MDRPASWLGIPAHAAIPALLDHFQVPDLDALRLKLGDDVYPVELPYHSPFSDAIYMAFDFAKSGHLVDEERTLNSPGFFEDMTDAAEVENFDWPDPAQYISPEECRAVVEAALPDRAVLGVVWSAHFQDACAAFGMETALMNMVAEPEIFRAVIDRITDFYLKANGIFYEATRGKLDAVLIGNDFGSQQCLMLSRELIREFVWPGTRQLVAQAKSYGLKVIHHSCGAIQELIPDLIEIGVDVIHPIQALAHRDVRRGIARQIRRQGFLLRRRGCAEPAGAWHAGRGRPPRARTGRPVSHRAGHFAQPRGHPAGHPARQYRGVFRRPASIHPPPHP